MNSIRIGLAILASLTFLTSCSKEDGDKKDKKGGLWGISEDLNVNLLKVVDAAGNPVANAQVLVGNSVGQPFADNFISTDAQGHFEAPAGWVGAEAITINAPGFVRVTYFEQEPNGQTYTLRHSTAAQNFELKGQGTGFQTKDKDNKVDFALMIQSLRKEDLFSFDLGMLISPQMDKVEVYGQEMQIPSNVALPKQKESYGIFPVTLEKPQYRMYFPTAGVKKVFTVRGQFPFKEVVKELQDQKQFVELVNYFDLQGGSIEDVTLSGPSTVKDLPVNKLQFNQKRAFKAPVIGSDEFLLAVPVSKYQGTLLPTDMKQVASNASFQLKTAAGDMPDLLVVVKKSADKAELGAGRLTAALVPFEVNVTPKLLPMVENPTVVSPSEIRVPAINTIDKVEPAATYVVKSKVAKRIVDNVVVSEQVTKVWEAYAPEWQTSVKLPQWPNETPAGGGQRFEVLFVGTGLNKLVDLGPNLLDNATHATHGATEF